ncbi:MAG: hypothetical protein JNL44_14555 [Gemmatimonadetes bacterium]|nr:hypothetical protein [Gemmatimonadota bacterium]
MNAQRDGSISSGTYAAAALTSVGVGVLFVHVLLGYWSYFELGSDGGRAMFATLIALPISVVGAAGVGVAVTARSEGRGRRGTGIVARAVGLSAAVFAALLALEMWRTWELHDPDLQRSLGGFLRALLHV